jgi:hypothetical protein
MGCLLAVVVCLVAARATADSDLQSDTLKGLGRVTVLVESLQPEVEREGLATSTLQADVDLKLRQAGIRDGLPGDKNLGWGMLYVNVNALNLRKGGLRSAVYTFSVIVQLSQLVTLSRDPKITSLAVTWNDAAIGSADARELSTAIRRAVRDKVDEFINAYRVANPR